MGADYKSYAVIGIKIENKLIPRKKHKMKAFTHDFPENWVADPTTGRKLWQEYDEPEFSFDAYERASIKPKLPTGVAVFYETNNGGEEPAFVLGYGITGVDFYTGCKVLPDVDKLKADLKELLTPLGLWDEQKFGLYSICHCSY
jgi:hypothetical protein